MNIETQKNNLCINQIVGQKTENIIIEGDVIIPDIKPDILNAINTNGTVCIYKKEVLDGKIRIDGCINCNIMYLADNEESSVRGISSNIDFSKTIELEKARSKMMVECQTNLKSMECKILNGRKVSIKSILEVNARVSVNEDVEFVDNITNINDIQRLNKEFNMNSLLGAGETRAFAKDTVAIEQIDNLAEIIKTNVCIINKETKISYNKVLAKADVSVKIMYLTEDNRVCSVKSKIPVMGFIDIQNVSEENICDVRYDLRNLLIKPNNVEEHSIYIEAEVGMECKVYENKRVNLIQDLYSPSVELNSECKKLKTMQEKRRVQDVCNIRQKQEIPEIKNEKIYDTDVSVNIQNQNVMNDRIIYEGEIEINFIFSSNKTGGLDCKKIAIPFNHNMEVEGVVQGSRVSTQVEVAMQDFIVMPDESIDIKIDLNFSVDISKSTDVNIINNINIEENSNQDLYSVVIYFVKPGDTLWEIAKKFKSTVDDIARMNEIEDANKIDVGMQLFIPRYVPIMNKENA